MQHNFMMTPLPVSSSSQIGEHNILQFDGARPHITCALEVNHEIAYQTWIDRAGPLEPRS